jgi:hypothetical protein
MSETAISADVAPAVLGQVMLGIFHVVGTR